jgi:hypothetical protein
MALPLSLSIAACALSFSSEANAADATRFPPALRGDFEIQYDVGGETGRLFEDDVEVG